MSNPRIGIAVLAAGSSQRFGETDKLAQPFRGKLLGEHVAAAIPVHRSVDGCAWAITSRSNHPCEPVWRDAGMDIALNENASSGMGTSVSMAIGLAQAANLNALLIALADMPFVPREHFSALLGAFAEPEDIVCSSDGRFPMPPAIIGAAHFGSLSSLSGDKGARELLGAGRVLGCPPEWLIDIDTPEALQKYGQT